MTPEEFEELKEEYLDHIKSQLSEEGGLIPHFTVFADMLEKNDDDENDNRKSVIHLVVPADLVDTDEGKDIIVEEILPKMMVKIKKQFVPHGIAWASEAWMRIADKDFDVTKQDFRSIKTKKEVLFISMETRETSEAFVYEIKREGKQVNPDGELVDKVDLIEMPDIKDLSSSEGRLSGLFKKLKL